VGFSWGKEGGREGAGPNVTRPVFHWKAGEKSITVLRKASKVGGEGKFSEKIARRKRCSGRGPENEW